MHADVTKRLVKALWKYREDYETLNDITAQAQSYARWLAEEAKIRHRSKEHVDADIQDMVRRVESGEPLAYVIGMSQDLLIQDISLLDP